MSRTSRAGTSARHGGPDERRWDVVRRAFREFLAVPTLVITAFVALAAATYVLDRAAQGWDDPVRGFLERHIFNDTEATSDLLGTVAGAVITVTSITISLLLVAIQQSASTLTAEVFDQFLRRRHNQVYFGFFIGLALYTLLTLATVNAPFNPAYGASLTIVLTGVALYLLLVLFYTTVNQMRPVEIIDAIHDHTLAARSHLLDIVRRTRRAPWTDGGTTVSVIAERHGFVVHVDVARIGAAVHDAAAQGAAPAGTEIVLRVSMGTFVSFGDSVAEIRAPVPSAPAGAHEPLAHAVRDAIRLERERDIAFDPAYGIEQLEMIAWTSISTAKSNPAPGLLGIQALRDLLARWSAEDGEVAADVTPSEVYPVVFEDPTFGRLLGTLESLAVVASESLQHQSLAEVVRALTATVPRLPAAWRERTDAVVLRLLSSLGEHVLTMELDDALTALGGALRATGRVETAAALASAQHDLRQSIGRLGARATRVTAAERP